MNVNDVFCSLKRISGYIYTLYRKLATYEFKGLINSKEYNDVLEEIKKYNDIEDHLIDYICSMSEENAIILCGLAQYDMTKSLNVDKLICDTSYIINNKIHENDIIDMRIAYKSSIRIANTMNDEVKNTYNIYVPLRNKYFIDLIDQDLKDMENNKYKNMLIDAKYDYSYINFLNPKKKFEDLSSEELEEYKSVSIGELNTIGEKLIKFNKKTLLDKRNERRTLLNMYYIRANNINNSDEDDERLSMSLLINNIDKINEGYNFFVELLDFKNNDRNINKSFSLKRKY